MVSSMPGGWGRPSPGSLLARWLERRQHHPDEFDCAVRVMSGVVAGESARWSYRRSAVDPLIVDGVIRLNHDRTSLQLRISGEQLPGGPRPAHVIWPAVEIVSGAQVEVAADVREGARFGVR